MTTGDIVVRTVLAMLAAGAAFYGLAKLCAVLHGMYLDIQQTKSDVRSIDTHMKALWKEVNRQNEAADHQASLLRCVIKQCNELTEKQKPRKAP